MPVKTLEERMKGSANEVFRAEIRYQRKFERELEKEFQRYRTQTPILFREAERGKKPRTILAEGDSWCRYVIGFAVPWHLPKLDSRNHVMNVASPGDTAAEMLSGTKARKLRAYIKSGPSRGRKFNVIVFSGGGNDLLGSGRFGRYLNEYESGMTAVQVINSERLKKALDLLDIYYERLVVMRNEESLKSLIYFNAYDFAQASGIGVCGRRPWLEPHLIDAGVPDNLHEDVVAVFLKRYEKRLKSMASRLGNNDIRIIGTQGTLSANQWENEIHPTKRGFRRIAKVFQEQLVADFP